jgi:hypothetical protein
VLMIAEGCCACMFASIPKIDTKHLRSPTLSLVCLNLFTRDPILILLWRRLKGEDNRILKYS